MSKTARMVMKIVGASLAFAAFVCLLIGGWHDLTVGCCGMKKRLRTVIDASAQGRSAILVSAGKIGRQVELAPEALAGLVGAAFAPIVKDGAA